MRVRLLSFAAVPLVFLAQCAPSGCEPAPPPPPAPVSFGNGTHLVGSQIPAGTYIAANHQGCYWERLSGLGGTFDEIIENDFSDGRSIVTIAPTDVAFNSSRCGGWVQYGAIGPVANFGDGDWAVNAEVAPGRWASDPTASGCYWERATGYGHGFDEIIANDFLDGQAIVDISATDVRFTSQGCGTWTRIG